MGAKGKRANEPVPEDEFESDEELGFEDPDKFSISDDPEVLDEAFKTQSFKFPLLRRTGRLDADGKEIVGRFYVEYVQLSWDRVNSLRHGKKLPKNVKRINAPFTKDLTLPILQAGIKYIIQGGNKIAAEITDGEPGTTNLRKGILSFNDLLPGQVKELEDLIAPGINKSGSTGEKRAVSANGAARETVREASNGTDGALRSVE
jgi:hypothetical protein